MLNESRLAGTPGADVARSVAVIVVQYGIGPLPLALVEGLRDPAVGAVIVVRNPRRAGDDTAPCPIDGALLVVMPENRGYGAAANAGRASPPASRCPLHLVVTHDVEFAEGCIGVLARTAHLDEHIGIVGPVLFDRAGHARVGGSRSRIGRVRHHEPESLPAERTGVVLDVDWIDGAVMLLRASSPPFPADFFLYGEDVAMCIRVGSLHRVVVALEAMAIQRSGMQDRPGVHGYLLVRNLLLFDRRDGGGSALRFGIARSACSIGRHAWHSVDGANPGRRHHLLQLAGSILGLVDGVRGRAGPPPRPLCRWSDVQFDSFPISRGKNAAPDGSRGTAADREVP